MSTGKYYVYKLRIAQGGYGEPCSYNPCNTEDGTLYIGKGCGNRMFAHEAATRTKLKKGNKQKLSYKDKVIIQAWDRGIEIVKEVVYRTDDEQEAFKVENELIEHYGLEYLTNEHYGHRKATRTWRTRQ